MRLVFFSSIDSFVGAFIMLICARRRIRYSFVIGAFAACDSIAGALGTLLATKGQSQLLLHADMLAVAIGISLTVILIGARKNTSCLWCLPVLLSLDNFLAGASGAFPSTRASFLSAMASGALAVLGLLGARALQWLSPRTTLAIKSYAPFLMWLIPIL